MRAKVKNIAFDTSVETDEYEDVFTMTDLIGKTINIEPKPKCPGWYTSGGYKWHKSWLDILPDTLLPDEPKAEWMQISDNGSYASFVNLATGAALSFRKQDKVAHVWSIHCDQDGTKIEDDYVPAFAALVGYTWKEG